MAEPQQAAVSSDGNILSVNFASSRNDDITAYSTGGGSDGGGGVDGRVARLEAHVAHIQSDVGEVKQRLTGIEGRVGAVEVNLATLVKRVAHLPSKGFIVKTVVTVGAILGALTLFPDQIRALFGL